MYQIRITDPDGSNPVILEKADNISYNKTINSANEGVSFDYPTSDPKASYIDNTKLWELWDTVSNVRKNRGPIQVVNDGDDGTLKITGAGRSQLLADHIKTDLSAFYVIPADFIDGLRYQNVAANPKTKTYVWDGKAATKSKFFGSVSIDEQQYMQYYGLSKQTKDNVIDENDGYIKPGTSAPSNTYYVTDSYWAGTQKKDSIIIDLGYTASIARLRLTFPWWGGLTRQNNRGFEFELSYSTDTGDFEDVNAANWVPIYEDTRGRHVRDWIFNFEDGENFGAYRYLGPPDVQARYFRVLIKNVHAWFGTPYDTVAAIDDWSWQCDPNTGTRGPAGQNHVSPMLGKKINDRVIEPPNDCYASLVEFYAYERILERNQISRLVKQRIKYDNKQIKYHHNADASETITTGGYRKYEPGTFFRYANVTYSGASSSYTKFYAADCANCYSAFNFGVMDDFNTLIYHSTSSSGSPTISSAKYATSIIMKGASNATVNSVDAWLGILDPLSWGGSYSYNKTTGDYCSIEFRGESFTWWATIPATETGATVLIKLRSKDDTTGAWSAWTTLESGLVLPNDITSEIVYQIPINTILQPDTSYEIYLENLDGGYISIDSIGGWWMGSMVEYNDDSDRIFLARPDDWKQIYDNRFSNGTMLKSNQYGNWLGWSWSGDRIQIYSAKGRNHGKLRFAMNHITDDPGEYDQFMDQRVFIPGGSPSDGTMTINLDTGNKGNEVPGILVFDSGPLTGWKFGPSGTLLESLPWGQYGIQYDLYFPTETYMADPTTEDSDQFVSRCSDCNPPTTGTEEINKYIFFDGINVHEYAKMSGSWKLQNHVDIIASVTEALELEWDIGEQGLTVLPRLGEDKDIILLEGINTVISSEVVRDGNKMASQLISSGADIDGLPLFTVVEDRKNREILGRTVQRIQDYRDVADYFTLVGVSRAELIRRREPEYRISVTHIGYKYGLEPGDSILVKKRRDTQAIRARINTITITQSKTGGIVYQLECEKWPPII